MTRAMRFSISVMTASSCVKGRRTLSARSAACRLPAVLQALRLQPSETQRASRPIYHFTLLSALGPSFAQHALIVQLQRP